MAKFVVDLGDVRLTPQAEAELDAQIQSAALAALARTDMRAAPPVRFQGDWLGMVDRAGAARAGGRATAEPAHG